MQFIDAPAELPFIAVIRAESTGGYRRILPALVEGEVRVLELAMTTSGTLDAWGVPISVVDTVGAGDAFAAAYLHALFSDTGPVECLKLASRVATSVCSSEGDWERLPPFSEIGLVDEIEPVAR